MLTIENVRVCLYILGFFVACFTVIAYAWRNPAGAAKLLCLVAIVVLGIVGFASAEPAEVEYYSVDRIVATEVVFDSFWLTTRIDFVYHKDILSWYEDGFAMPWNHYIVKVWREREVVNSALM